MSTRVFASSLALFVVTQVSGLALGEEKKEETPAQYQFETISIPPASAEEPKLHCETSEKKQRPRPHIMR